LAGHPWHLRHIRGIIYIGLVIAIISIFVVSYQGVSEGTPVNVSVREYSGLWALALLLASMLPGPLNYVFPWLPLRGHLVLGRRALGVSAFVFAVLHVISYLGPTLATNWHELYTPGKLWGSGLMLGIPLFIDMAVLAFTSRNKAVRNMGPHKWKKWHKTVYILLPLVLVHAIFLGADFGVNHGPDVKAGSDAGALVTMLILTAVWLALFLLRKYKVRLAPQRLRRISASSK